MPSRALLIAAAAALAAAACGDDASGNPAPPPDVCADNGGGVAETAQALRPLQCGPTSDFTPVNEYQGELSIVGDREDAVVLIPLITGNCTGTLIAAQAGPVVLTAGHCAGLGDQMTVAFNVEGDPDGDPLATTGTVIEQSAEPDYALLRLEALPAGVTPTPLTALPSDRLAIIQHPRAQPKSVAEGRYLATCGARIVYADLDTLGGSSGAGVLTREGRLVGIHTDGDCSTDGTGTNRGWAAADIVRASPHLQAADIEGCPDC